MKIRGYLATTKVAKVLISKLIAVKRDELGRCYVELEIGDRVLVGLLQMKNWVSVWTIRAPIPHPTGIYGLNRLGAGSFRLKGGSAEALLTSDGVITVYGRNYDEAVEMHVLLIRYDTQRYGVCDRDPSLESEPEAVITWEATCHYVIGPGEMVGLEGSKPAPAVTEVVV